jgi:hypothetical protein
MENTPNPFAGPVADAAVSRSRWLGRIPERRAMVSFEVRSTERKETQAATTPSLAEALPGKVLGRIDNSMRTRKPAPSKTR